MSATPVLASPVSPEISNFVAEVVRFEVDRALARRSRKLALLVSSGELDKLMVAAIVASAAAAMDYEVDVFFAFWGLSAIRIKSVLEGKQPIEKLMTLMLGSGSAALPVSRFNFFGLGAKFLERLMRDKNTASLEELLQLAEESGVRMSACQMSMDVMGIRRDELRPSISVCGVAAFLVTATACGATLTI